MDHKKYCTVLEVVSVINTDIFGFTFWVSFVKLIDSNNDISDGIVYFLNKADALNVDIGDRLLDTTVFHKNLNPQNR